MVSTVGLSTAERVRLIQRNTEEVIGADEIAPLLEQGLPLRHYIGLEISGKIHLGTGLMVMQKVRDLQRAGVRCTIFLADWHTWLNNKLGGERERIKEVAEKYFKKGLKASLKAVGGDPDQLDFVLGSDLYHHNDQYWETLIQVCKNTSLSRIERSISIMGRKEGDAVDFAMLIYPPMQVADIFALQANFAHGGIDQRKAHVIARDVAETLDILPLKDRHGKTIKPIILHTSLLLGLDKPPTWPLPTDPAEIRAIRTQMKMSKSRPASAVFIHDTPDEIRKKIRKAFCPPETEYNPVLDWIKNLVFNNDLPFYVARTPANGGDVTFAAYDDLLAAYTSGALHPGDLKNGCAEALISLMEPIRADFEGDATANAIWQNM
jgi:tyrosyl-tRNA synthetase